MVLFPLAHRSSLGRTMAGRSTAAILRHFTLSPASPPSLVIPVELVSDTLWPNGWVAWNNWSVLSSLPLPTPMEMSLSCSSSDRIILLKHLVWLFIYSYIGKKHLQTAIHHVLSKPMSPRDNSPTLVFAVIRVPFFLEPDYDESLPFIESNRDRLIKKWGGKQGWELQKQRHE